MERFLFLVVASEVVALPLTLPCGATDKPYDLESTFALWQEKKIDMVLDVRSKLEYSGSGTQRGYDDIGHIPDSYLVENLGANPAAASEVAACKDAVVAVSCYSGARARAAANILKNVYNFSCVFNIGGVGFWDRSGYPVEKGNWDESTPLPAACTPLVAPEPIATEPVSLPASAAPAVKPSENENCIQQPFEVRGNRPATRKFCLDASKKRLAVKKCNGKPSQSFTMTSGSIMKGDKCVTHGLTLGACGKSATSLRFSQNGAGFVVKFSNGKCFSMPSTTKLNAVKCDSKAKSQQFIFSPIVKV